MNENFTSEDFARANLATRGEFDVARRVDPRDTHQWYAYGGEPVWFSDEEMAADGWTPVVESRVTLDSLAAAWEAAEQADECRKDDVLIIQDDEDNYVVRRMDDRSRLDSTARILSRASKPREPWQDLADELEELFDGDSAQAKEAAALLHERGVRVTGGEES